MMSTIKNIEVKGHLLYLIGGLISFLFLLLFVGCSKEGRSASPESMSEPALSIRLTGVNESGKPETTVQMVRLIIADDYTGEVLYNDRLTWASQEAPKAGRNSDPIKWKHGAGSYDFYLIANEVSLSKENKKRLIEGLYNISNLEALESVAFEATEIKILNSTDKPLLSTAVLKSHVLEANKPEDNPEVISAKLVRNLSKISVEVYRKKKAEGEVNHAVIDKMQLRNVASDYHLFFTPQPYSSSNPLLRSKEFGSDIASYNPDDMTLPLFKSDEYYLAEYLFGVNETVLRPTLLKIWYRPNNETGTAQRTIEFPVEVHGLHTYRDEVLTHIGHGATSLNNVSEQSVMRGIHYKIKIDITDEKVKPVVNITVVPWDVEEQDVTHTDYILNSTKEEVMLNYPAGASNSLMILSNIKDRRALRWRVEGDDSWLRVTPNENQNVQLDGLDKQYTFEAISENSGGEPRSVVIVFSAVPYQHSVRVKVTQRPRQVMLSRRYVSFIGEGGEALIDVENYGYGWDASIVSNVSTMSHHSNWLTLEKVPGTDNKQQLKVTVESTNDYDLIRHAVIKVYDGSKHASYIWVEQGNYKPVTVIVNGIVTQWLDRNLGALYSPRHKKAWFAGGEITSRERVKRNGYFYQYGRVPDGSHILGIDLVRGTIRPSLLSGTEISYTPLDLQLRPEGFPLKWDDLGKESMTGEPASDEQYGKFISHKSSWFTPSTTISQPSWTKPNGSKNEGVDPCPEGYRVPRLDEYAMFLQINRNGKVYKGVYSCGYWIPALENGRDIDLYFPMSGFRNQDGYLDLNYWFWSETIEARYGTSTLDSNGDMRAFYWSYYGFNNKSVPRTTGVAVRCIKE